MVHEMKDAGKASPLFEGWEETLIWCCLPGVMGKIYADDPDHPTAVMAVIGDFTFFAGKPDTELASFKPGWCKGNFRILVPQDRAWEDRILEIYGEKAKITSRYAIKKEPDIFDREKLKRIVSLLPEGYELSMIDEYLYHMCRSQSWSADLVSQFPDYETYQKLGIGAVVCKDRVVVSGASSYSRYLGGIEIEIDTREDYRRKSLASVCAARLILECLKRNLYPSWDAQNPGSVALAEKLGYHYSHTYTANEIYDLQ